MARLAPAGNIGGITGAVVAFGGSGMMSYPVLFALIVDATGNFGMGFFLGAIPAFVMSVRLLGRPAEGAAPSALVGGRS